MLRTFGWLKIPLIAFIRPQVIVLDKQTCQLKVRLRRRVKNHLNGMYFGALAIAAECTGGVAVMKAMLDSNRKISLVFKDFHAEFYKRVEGDAIFVCEDVAQLYQLVEKTIESGERQSYRFNVTAVCPEKFQQEPVALFTVTVSLKLIT